MIINVIDRQTLTIRPAEIRPDDFLVNLGTVAEVNTQGVMTEVRIYTVDYSLLTGKGYNVTISRVYHCADEVMVTRATPTVSPAISQ